MKNKTFIDSVKCAIRGFTYAIKTEKNFKYYFGILILFLTLDLIVNVVYIAYIFALVAFFGACSTECINTAIEHFADMEHKEIHEEVRIIKDVAAAGILVWGLLFFISELVFLVMGVIAWF